MTDYSFNPDWRSPPGDTISDILEERSISREEFARKLAHHLPTTFKIVTEA